MLLFERRPFAGDPFDQVSKAGSLVAVVADRDPGPEARTRAAADTDGSPSGRLSSPSSNAYSVALEAVSTTRPLPSIDIVPVVFGRGKPYLGTLANGHLMLQDPVVVTQCDGVLHLRCPVHRGRYRSSPTAPDVGTLPAGSAQAAGSRQAGGAPDLPGR